MIDLQQFTFLECEAVRSFSSNRVN
uniref:Uncharacterized protein n=1 Tax=Anguilla anguilla TaxID=7936 RepID=A0A0E9TZS2_ANGAN